MIQDIVIQVKRAETFIKKDSDSAVTKELKDKIANYILEYGELIYLSDLDILIVGNGKQFKTEAEARVVTTNPQNVRFAEDVRMYIGGSTVEELYKAKEYFAKVLSPTLYGEANYIYKDGKEEIPIVENSTIIATVGSFKKYSDGLVSGLKSELQSKEQEGSAGASKANTLTYFKQTNGKVVLKFEPIEISYTQIDDAAPDKTNTPKMDGADSHPDGFHGESTNWSPADHIHPQDSSKANLSGATFTGNIILPAVDPTENNQAVRKKYVDDQITSVKSSLSTINTKKQNKSDIIYITGVVNSAGTGDITSQLQYCGKNSSASSPAANTNGVTINCKTGALFGAAWNDFAEFRKCDAEPGTVVCETGKGDLMISEKKLQPGAAIVSDTYGMIIGPQEEGYQPIAVAGRVLVKYLGNKVDYQPGMPVCAGPNGVICPMTRFEIKEFPESIVGYVSEIPTYDEWNNIKVNNRIWIKVK